MSSDCSERSTGSSAPRAPPERAVQEKAYLKSDLDHYGVSVPAVRAVARAVAQGPSCPDPG